MEQDYSCTQDQCKLVSARPETIRFLMSFSRSYHPVRVGDHHFDNNLN